MEILKSKSIKSEIKPSIPITLFHEGLVVNKNYTYVEYEVRGTVFSINTNTRLEINKRFSEISDAENYFEKIIKEFPKSEVILKSNSVTELKLYI